MEQSRATHKYIFYKFLHGISFTIRRCSLSKNASAVSQQTALLQRIRMGIGTGLWIRAQDTVAEAGTAALTYLFIHSLRPSLLLCL